MRITQYAIVVSGLVLMSTQYVFAGDTALTTDEVITLISGKTVYATSSRGYRYEMYFGADGSLANSSREEGVWEVKDGSVCNTYGNRGFAGCDKVYRKDDGTIFYIVPNGKKGEFHEFVEGRHVR